MAWRDVLEQALAEHREAILDFTRDLIRIPSENPPGAAYGECLARVEQELDRLGLPHQLVEVAGFPDTRAATCSPSWARATGRSTSTATTTWCPPSAGTSSSPRSKGSCRAGVLGHEVRAGGHDLCRLLLKEVGAPLRGRIGLCVVADEETGGQGGSRYLTEAGLLGRGGIAMVTPEPTSGVVWNANRGAVTLRVTVIGRPAHVGLQFQGINAFEQMVEVVRELQVLKAEVEQRRSAFRIEPAEAAQSILMLGGQVEGGTNFNVVPGGALHPRAALQPRGGLRDREEAAVRPAGPDAPGRDQAGGGDPAGDPVQRGARDDPAARALAKPSNP